MLKQLYYRVLKGLVPICFNTLNLLLLGNLPPLGCACVIVEDEGRFLLVRQGSGSVTFPGGFMRWNEHPAETAQRELHEETGLRVRLLATLGTYSTQGKRMNRINTLTVVFAGEIVGGALQSSIEGRPYWLDELEMRRVLSTHYTDMLEDYFIYRDSRKQG